MNVSLWSHEESSEEDKKTFASYRNQVLHMLKQGPQTTFTLKQVTHRFSCCISDLAKLGHEIKREKDRDSTGWRYVYMGFDESGVITDRLRNSYYSTAHWRSIRRKRLDLDDFMCCMCKSCEDLHVHHWKYDLFDEDIRDLMTLCKRCHEFIHSHEKITISFPDITSKQIIDRLKHEGDQCNTSE